MLIEFRDERGFCSESRQYLTRLEHAFGLRSSEWCCGWWNASDLWRKMFLYKDCCVFDAKKKNVGKCFSWEIYRVSEKSLFVETLRFLWWRMWIGLISKTSIINFKCSLKIVYHNKAEYLKFLGEIYHIRSFCRNQISMFRVNCGETWIVK